MTQTAVPAIEGWFTTGTDGHGPALLGQRCGACATVHFPRVTGGCRNPACTGEELTEVELGRHGTVWSYTDAQYQPPAPYVPASDPYEPFAIAAVEVPEGIVVLGQLAHGWTVADVQVGSEVELVVETAYVEEGPDGEVARLMWKWKPVAELGSEADPTNDGELTR